MIAMVRAHPAAACRGAGGDGDRGVDRPGDRGAHPRAAGTAGFYERQPTAGLWVPLAFRRRVPGARPWPSYASSYKISGVSQAVLVELRRRMFERLLHWPQATIESTPLGDRDLEVSSTRRATR